MNAVTPPMRERMSRETTELALTETVLSPRFYTTDFSAMDAIDVEPVRAEWDRLMEEFRQGTNKGDFVRDVRCEWRARSGHPQFITLNRRLPFTRIHWLQA